MTEIGLFLNRGGALLSQVVRQLSEMGRKTSVQLMVAKWRRFFLQGGRRK